MFKVYVGALYLQQKTNASAAILGDGGVRRVALHMLREVASDQFFAALSDGLKNNHTLGQVAKFEVQLRQLEGVFSAGKVAKSGDVIVLDMLADDVTRIMVNGKIKGRIAGVDFSRTLLRIWHADNPAEAALEKRYSAR